MPRDTGFLLEVLASQLQEACDLAAAVEASSTFVYNRRLHVYEAAYLLAFSSWENFLEQSFLRFICGYKSSIGPIGRKPAAGNPKTLVDASKVILKNRGFLLWHNPQPVIDRSQTYFMGGPHELVLLSARTEIEKFAHIRHYVAHRNFDTKVKFQAAATYLTGSAVIGGRAGRMLRGSTIDPVSGDSVSWLERICRDLERFGRQIA